MLRAGRALGGHRLWGSPFGWDAAYAYQMYATGPYQNPPFLQQPNGGAYPPQFGDLLVFDQTSFDPSGHVAVVTSVGDGYVNIVEQNWGDPDPTGYASLPIGGDVSGVWDPTYMPPRWGLPILGWLESTVLRQGVAGSGGALPSASPAPSGAEPPTRGHPAYPDRHGVAGAHRAAVGRPDDRHRRPGDLVLGPRPRGSPPTLRLHLGNPVPAHRPGGLRVGQRIASAPADPVTDGGGVGVPLGHPPRNQYDAADQRSAAPDRVSGAAPLPRQTHESGDEASPQPCPSPPEGADPPGGRAPSGGPLRAGPDRGLGAGGDPLGDRQLQHRAVGGAGNPDRAGNAPVHGPLSGNRESVLPCPPPRSPTSPRRTSTSC